MGKTQNQTKITEQKKIIEFAYVVGLQRNTEANKKKKGVIGFA